MWKSLRTESTTTAGSWSGWVTIATNLPAGRPVTLTRPPLRNSSPSPRFLGSDADSQAPHRPVRLSDRAPCGPRGPCVQAVDDGHSRPAVHPGCRGPVRPPARRGRDADAPPDPVARARDGRSDEARRVRRPQPRRPELRLVV